MSKFKGLSPMKQKMIKLWLRCDADSVYIYDMIVYYG